MPRGRGCTTRFRAGLRGVGPDVRHLRESAHRLGGGPDRSQHRGRRARRDRRWRPEVPVPMSVAGGRFTSTSKATPCAAAADVPPRGRRADTSRGAVGQPRPNPRPRRRSRQSGHRRVRRLAAPDRVRVNRHGSGDPEFPGSWRPIPTILPGPPLVPRSRLSQHERDPCRFSESRSAVPTRPSSRPQARGSMSSPPSCSSRSIDPLKPHPARLDSRLRQTGSVPVLQIPRQSVGQSSDLWSHDTEYPPSDPCGHS